MAVAVACPVLLTLNFVPDWRGWAMVGVGVGLVSYWMMGARNQAVRWVGRAGLAICGLVLAATAVDLLPSYGPLPALHSVVAATALVVAIVAKHLWFKRVKT
jgi:hypothetical protein